MAWKNKAIIGAFLTNAIHIAAAQAPVTLSGPTPAIDASYSVGSEATVTYTLANYAPSNSPISVTVESPLSRVNSSSNDCGTSLKAGSPTHPSTCQVSIKIKPNNSDSRQTINQTVSVNYQGRSPLTSPVSFTVPALPYVLVTTGQNWTDSNATPALLLQRIDDGTGWAPQTIEGAFPDNGVFNTASCSGASTSAVCIAAGSNDDTNKPLLAQTLNGGGTWSVETLTGLTPSSTGIFNASACTDNGALCLAVGSKTNSGTTTPLIARSSNGTWSYVDLVPMGITSSGELTSCSCSGSGSTAVCVAAGSNTNDPMATVPLLLQSTNAGMMWASAAVPTPLTAGAYYSSSCNASVCVAVGFSGDVDTYSSFIEQYTIATATWSSPTIDLTNIGGLMSVSCTGSDASTLCAASGFNVQTIDGDYLQSTFILQTLGTNATWTEASLPTLPSASTLLSISCSGNDDDVRCAAAGGSQITSAAIAPLILQKQGTNDWTISDLNTSVEGYLTSTSCTGSGIDAICFAAGGAPLVGNTVHSTRPALNTFNHFSRFMQHYSDLSRLIQQRQPVTRSHWVSNGYANTLNTAPFIFQSIDGTATWLSPSIQDNPTTAFVLSTAATSTATPI